MPLKTHFFNSTPFAKLIIPLILGILLAYYINLDTFKIEVLLICLSSIFLIAHFVINKPKFLFFVSFIGYVLIFFIGFFLAEKQELRNKPKHFANLLKDNNDQVFMYGNIAITPEGKANSIKVLANIHQLQYDSTKKTCEGKMLLYLQKDSISLKLKKGDGILFLTKLVKISPPKNPGEFNYAAFMANKNIFYQQYLPSNSYTTEVSNRKDYLELFKHYYLNLLQKNVKNTHSLALAKGLIIGQRSEIDQQIYESFSHTGIIHILSVSGLHLGIVMTILIWLFSFFPYSSIKWKWIKTIIILFFIWTFAIITGFSTAVQRAALMASIFIIGKEVNKKASNYNILFASLFIICLFNPLVLKDLGLQLSYLALIGLAVFYKEFYNLCIIKNKIGNKIWEWTATSFAAQTTTLPLTIFWFGNFPTYFLLANPPAILLSFVILGLGLVLMVFGWIPAIGQFLGFLINYACLALLTVINWINGLPFAICENIYSNKYNLLLNFSTVLLLILAVINRKFKWYLITGFCIISSFIIATKEKITLLQKPASIVYSIPKNTILTKVIGQNIYFFGDTIFDKKNANYNFKIKGSIRQLGAKNIYFNEKKDSIFVINGNKILLWNNQFNYTKFSKKVVLDYILLSKKSFLDFENLNKNFDFNMLILDESIKSFKLEKLKASFKAQNIQFYSVSENGAFQF